MKIPTLSVLSVFALLGMALAAGSYGYGGYGYGASYVPVPVGYGAGHGGAGVGEGGICKCSYYNTVTYYYSKNLIAVT